MFTVGQAGAKAAVHIGPKLGIPVGPGLSSSSLMGEEIVPTRS